MSVNHARLQANCVIKQKRLGRNCGVLC